jgi:hypothetical protein
MIDTVSREIFGVGGRGILMGISFLKVEFF